MVGFCVPAGFEPVTLTSRSGLTTHSVTDCSTPRGLLIELVTILWRTQIESFLLGPLSSLLQFVYIWSFFYLCYFPLFIIVEWGFSIVAYLIDFFFPFDFSIWLFQDKYVSACLLYFQNSWVHASSFNRTHVPCHVRWKKQCVLWFKDDFKDGNLF